MDSAYESDMVTELRRVREELALVKAEVLSAIQNIGSPFEPEAQLLTTREAARYLRIKERKLYELLAEDAIPATKVTGKWVFPRRELDAWIGSSLIMRSSSTTPD